MRKKLVMSLGLVLLLLLTACSASQDVAPAVSEQTAAAMVDESGVSEEAPEELTTETQADHPQGDEVMAEDTGEVADEMADVSAAEPGTEEGMSSDLPAWQTLALTDARTGESFTLADFAGKTVFVEPMATWCTNCRRQLGNVKDARAQLAAEDVLFVGLSVETNIDDATLASYAEGAGFDWLFAVLTPEMLQELAAEFGQTIANPPATPHFVIRPDGSATDLVTGIEPADQIIAQIQAARG